MKETYWANQVEIQRQEVAARLAFAEGKPLDALAGMRAVAAQEDETENSAVTPGPLAPAREQLGDLLLELKQASEALKEFESTLVKEPNRFRSLYGEQPRRPGWAAIGRLSKSTSRSCSRSLNAPINLDGKNLTKLIAKSIRSNKCG